MSRTLLTTQRDASQVGGSLPTALWNRARPVGVPRHTDTPVRCATLSTSDKASLSGGIRRHHPGIPLMSNSVNTFNRAAGKLIRTAQDEGKNITKAQVFTALATLKADGKISKADKEAAKALLERAPLTAGAKEELKEFIHTRATTGGSRGGGVRGGGEAGGGE